MAPVSASSAHHHETFEVSRTVVQAFEAYERAAVDSSRAGIGEALGSLVAFAVALAVPSPEVAADEADAARTAGASEQEIAEAVYASAALRAGGAWGYGRLGLKMVASGKPQTGDSKSCEMYSRLDTGRLAELRHGDPGAFEALLGIVDALHSNLTLSDRSYELIASAVAITTQCAYCIDKHFRAATEAGASRHELSGVIHIVASTRVKCTLAVARGILGSTPSANSPCSPQQ